MAVREIDVDDENLKINVILRDGTKYLAKDITEQPFGEYERMVGFWMMT